MKGHGVIAVPFYNSHVNFVMQFSIFFVFADIIRSLIQLRNFFFC